MLKKYFDCVYFQYSFIIYSEAHSKSMQAYTNMMKTLYTTGKDYLWNNQKAKEPMIKVDKTATLYQAKSFNDSRIDPKKCISILAKFIYLFNQGQNFTQDQSVSLFFSITKLLQTDDPQLKRLIYTFIKEMSDQPSIYVVTSTLMKDIHHENPNYRRNSLRVIPVVMDASILAQVERYIKQLMNDSDAGVSSASLLASLSLYQTNDEIVKKWAAEVGQKLKSKDKNILYHALALIGEIKKKDTKYLNKTIQSLSKQPLQGLAAVQHLRMYKILTENLQHDSKQISQFMKFVLKQVKNVDDIVVIEAAKIACESSFFSNKDLLEVVKVLEKFLVSESTAKKYTVLKLYNNLLKNPSRKNLVINVKEIEKVLSDKNVNLSATAASILLRICSEDYLHNLLKRLFKTMDQMSIDYRIDVIKSLANVLSTYPKQYSIINNFVFQILKNQQSEDLRRQAIEVLSFEITQIGGQAKKQCLQELAKFLSFAKYQKVHFQILGIINRQIKSEDVTSDLLKSLINQIYLQQGSIRACGLSTLIKISQINTEKKKVLERTIAKFENDRDQEVRERVIFRPSQEKINHSQLDMIERYFSQNIQKINNSKDSSVLTEKSIRQWTQQFPKTNPIKDDPDKKSNRQTEEYKHYKELFLNHSTFQQYGPLRKMNKKVRISDVEGEIQVEARTLLFDSNLVIVYEIENKTQNIVLENVKVQIKHSGEQFETLHIVPSKQIGKNSKGETYIGLAIKEKESEDEEDDQNTLIPQESISSLLKFTAKKYQGETLKVTYEDDLSLQNFDIKISTYLSPWIMEISDFNTQWNTLKSKFEVYEGTYQLPYASKQAAIKQIIKKYGINCVSNLQGKNSKIQLSLAGKYLGQYKILMNFTIGFDTKLGCLVKAVSLSDKQGLEIELVEALV